MLQKFQKYSAFRCQNHLRGAMLMLAMRFNPAGMSVLYVGTGHLGCWKPAPFAIHC
nr:MAG TPA: Putative NAD(P)-binding [Caudoviricetes sp.]DAU59855.1 MAG TPA: Putative NAD(P)-binding [Caudoviricetes sp.]